MRAEDLRRFALRDWELLAALKAEYWVAEKRRLGPAGALRLGDRLREYVRALRPDWPDEAEREADLAHHIRLSEALRSVVLPRSD
ncbi:MAG TPA: hypothetical protein VFS60_07950 [Thermoanaerobaculia bacterium]|nr:hypothetical protein [Thermoanaerobaculia bacterium]